MTHAMVHRHMRRTRRGKTIVKQHTRKVKEYIKGGMARGKPDSRYNKKQLAMGRKVEMEHTKNPKIANEIAKDHLEEFPNYYTELAKMEKGLEKKTGKKAKKNFGMGLYQHKGMPGKSGVTEIVPIEDNKQNLEKVEKELGKFKNFPLKSDNVIPGAKEMVVLTSHIHEEIPGKVHLTIAREPRFSRGETERLFDLRTQIQDMYTGEKTTKLMNEGPVEKRLKRAGIKIIE